MTTLNEDQETQRYIRRRSAAPNGHQERPPTHQPLRHTPADQQPAAWQPRGYIDFSTATLVVWTIACWLLVGCAVFLSIWSFGETFTYAAVAFPAEQLPMQLAFSLLVQFGAQPLLFMANYSADPVAKWAMRGVAIALNLIDMGTNINGYSILLAENPPPALPAVPVLGSSFFPYTGYAVAIIATVAEEGITRCLGTALHFTAATLGDFGITPPQWMLIKDRSNL